MVSLEENFLINASAGSSTAMPEHVQAKMENSFGTDFSGVNIQQNSEKAQSMGALAYTQVDNLHFAPGQFKPESFGVPPTNLNYLYEQSVTNPSTGSGTD